MAIVEYKCDTCKRTIELPRDIEGLERVQRCTITHGCRGKLYQTKVFPDFIRGRLPDDVSGLDNWIQRKVLHNHTQAIERDEWIIEHNMGVYPSVSVFVDRPIEGDLDNREEIQPEDIIIVDDNTILLRFDRPWSGIAQLVGRQSDPDLLQPFAREVAVTEQPYQFSLSGEISIATRINTVGENPSISLTLEYDTSSGTTPSVLYSADDQPSINSAWVDYNRVVINGKIYTVRSFNGLVTEMTTGVINSGATFRFTSIDEDGDQTFRDIEPGEVLILLSTDPYQIVDKIQDRFIDVTNITLEQNPFGFYYDNGEFFALENVATPVYPLIRSV